MKSIVVPQNKQAEIDLDYDQADESDFMTWNLTDGEYKELENRGIFNQINDLCGVFIDEFEDEYLSAGQLSIVAGKFSGVENPVVRKLMRYIHEAIRRGTSISFYF